MHIACSAVAHAHAKKTPVPRGLLRIFCFLGFFYSFINLDNHIFRLNSRDSPSGVTLTLFVISIPLISNVDKEYSGIKSCIMIVFRLMSTAFVFFFVKCASGNFQILVSVKNKSCL